MMRANLLEEEMNRFWQDPRDRARQQASRPAILTLAVMTLAVASCASACFNNTSRALIQGAPLLQVKRDQVVAFVGVSVVPMDQERILPGQTVIVREGRIAELGRAEEVKVPAAALKVDGRGKYLIPGLADLHAHLKQGEEQNNLILLHLYAASGATTILNMNGSPHHLALRTRLAKGEIFGPRLYTSGPFISNTPHAPSPSPEEVERAVIAHKHAGYDFIKIHGDFSAEAYRKLFEVARQEEMRVVGHAPRNLGIEPMLEARQVMVAHAEEFLEAYFLRQLDPALFAGDPETLKREVSKLPEKIPAIAEATARAGIWVTPNLTAYKNIGAQVENLDAVLARPEVKYVAPKITPWWMPEQNDYARRFKRERAWMFRAGYELMEKLVEGFQASGVRMLAGTDSLNPCVVPGFSIHDELEDLVTAGLTPYQAIKTATVNAAEFLGAASEFGTVTVGKRADLILIDGDPLKEIKNTTRRAGVMVSGQWLAEAEIRKLLGRIAGW
jgi:imidazolonepropionase-like amidohydrolase